MSPSIREETQTWDTYFRDRKSVLFLSYNRFWEEHPFVQQSLAQKLVESGVRVTWLDGFGWRSYSPKLYWKSKYLKVKQMFTLPGQRYPWVKRLNDSFQKAYLKRLVKKLGNPVIWVQAGIPNEITKALPYIDVFSTFDDPYRHKVGDPLCEKARLILCQNTYSLKRYQHRYSDSKNVWSYFQTGILFLRVEPMNLDRKKFSRFETRRTSFIFRGWLVRKHLLFGKPWMLQLSFI
jgi:hypothetical protein